MSELLTRAELIKLSRVLGTTEDQVGFLAPLGVDNLRKLEDRVTHALYDEHKGAFQKLADAGKLLPASLVAKLSEMVFGPVLSARVSGLMNPDKAIDVAERLKTSFLAEVTMQLDPRSAAELLKRMPVKIVIAVSQALLQRKEYVTMGRFVDDLSDEAIRKVTDSITDDTALVRIAYFAESRKRLNELIDLLGEERLKRVVSAVAGGPEEVQSAGLAMIGQFDERQLQRFGDAAIALGPRILNSLVAISQREDVTGIVARVMESVSARGRQSFAKMLDGMDAATLDAWAKSTREARLWPAALKILASSNADIQQQAAAALARLEKSERDAIGAVIRASGLAGDLKTLQATLG